MDHVSTFSDNKRAAQIHDKPTLSDDYYGNVLIFPKFQWLPRLQTGNPNAESRT